jgi:L-amino acid N-acyltransferase YncA
MAYSIVRPAQASDAAGIAAVHVQAWRETYAQSMPAEYLAALDQGQREAGWRTIIADDVTDVLVALDEDKVIGWASAGPGRDDCSMPQLVTTRRSCGWPRTTPAPRPSTGATDSNATEP